MSPRAGKTRHRSFLLDLTPDRFRGTGATPLARTMVQARLRDTARAQRLWTEVGRGFWTERARWDAERWKRHLRDRAVSFWIATLSGRDIGFFELREKRSGIKLEGFGLLPHWRGKGLGRQLLCIASEQAFASGARRIWLHTATDDHPHALANYKARGYRVYRERELRNPMRPSRRSA